MKALSLSIPAPCEQRWNDMQPVTGGRHCSNCNKTIIDFSLQTDAAIFDYIHNSKGEICGRFSGDQLHRSIAAPAPRRHSLMPAMVITAGLTVGIVTAGYAETRALEQIEMEMVLFPVADTSVAGKTHELPEIVVTAIEVKKSRQMITGVVCITNTEIKPRDNPRVVRPVVDSREPQTEKKRKKRFLFF